jgi:ATP/maltotriose-dependent transcriptional regulator MalT
VIEADFEAATQARHGYEAAVAQGARETAVGWAGFRGGIAKAQSRVVTAQAALREAVAVLEGRDAFQFVRFLLADLATAAALSGNVAAAAQWMERSDALSDGGNRMLDPWIELNRAWTIAADGDLARAARHARHAADLARAVEQYAIEAFALYDAARLGEAEPVGPRLDELAKTIDGLLAPALNMAASALASSDGHALDQTATALDDLGLALNAAELARTARRWQPRRGHA